jgi:hypothetical protein
MIWTWLRDARGAVSAARQREFSATPDYPVGFFIWNYIPVRKETHEPYSRHNSTERPVESE